MDARQRRRDPAVNARRIVYAELRDDWYRGAELMARLIAHAATGEQIVFVGFPRQWEPLLAHFGAESVDPIPPPRYIPLASDLSNSAVNRMIARAQREQRLRQLVEVFAASDPVVADVLHQLDRRVGFDSLKALPDLVIPLTGWQSYGRPEVQRFVAAVEMLPTSSRRQAVLLPCARKRPYDGSKTHKRIWRGLQTGDLNRNDFDAVVVSSIGVVPEAMWNDPVVLAYDSGVPDIYRTLRLMRSFFRKNHYDLVVDCLAFAPYSDCLTVVAREGLIGRIEQGPKGRSRKIGKP